MDPKCCSYIVAPQVLASSQAFHLLCEMFHLSQSHLHYYSSRPSDSVDWLSLIDQLGTCPFSPYTSSNKKFKNEFFKVAIEPLGHRYFTMEISRGDNTKYVLNLARYNNWPR